MEKELRFAVDEGKRYIGSYFLEEHPELMDNYRKVLKTLADFAQSYLDLKGWPGERGFGVKSKEHIEHHFHGEAQCFECDENKGFNEALHLCKLASLKDKVEVMSEEEIKEVLYMYQSEDLMTHSGTAKIAHALSGKIAKPKKIGSEEIAK